MRGAVLSLALLAMAVPAPVSAVGEETTFTLWVRGYPVTRGGVIRGCSLEYNAAGRDMIYKEGAGFGVVGNLTVNRIERDGEEIEFASLKVTLNDVVGDSAVPATPVDIHVVAADGTIMNEKSADAFDSDTPGSRVQPFLLADGFNKVMMGIVEKQRFTVAFNRREGGTDVHVPIDLTVQNLDTETGSVTRSDEMVRSFVSCLSKLANQ